MLQAARHPILYSRPGWAFPTISPAPEIVLDFDRGWGWQKSVSPVESFLTTTRASIGYADFQSGYWQAFTSNQPRITDKGLLVEESRTNLFLNSGAPATQSITVANGTVYTVSVVGTGSVTLSDAGTGTASQGSPVTFTAGSTSLTVTTAGITGSFVNVNVEAGAFATSPIRTTGSSAVRAADALTVNNPSSWMVPSVGTMFIDAEALTSSIVAISAFQFDAGSTTNRIQLSVDGTGDDSGGLIVTAGVTVASLSAAGTARNKVAMAYTTNDVAMSLNGASVLTDTSANIPTVTTARIGNNTAFWWNGYVRRVAYFPTRLSNAALQALTT